MRYILSPGISLRAFRGVERCYYRSDTINAFPLAEAEFSRLLRCDGTQELPEDETTRLLLLRGLIRPCEGEGARLRPGQAFRFCDNRYVPYLYLQITGKCNYNCLHCFNAKDNAALNTEMSLPQILALLDQAVDCGMHAVTITGGEPLCHPDFLRIIEAIRERELLFSELITNGSLLTEEILDRITALGLSPTIKISYDGIGFHDTMRAHRGAEEAALRAIRLCAGRGFRVLVQCNVNRLNASCIRETLELLDSMGVETARIIRTSESPRIEHRTELFLPIEEYYSLMTEILREYAAAPHQMQVAVWRFCRFDPAARKFSYPGENIPYRDSLPLCREARGKLSVSAEGIVYPCIQCSGVFLRDGLELGNVFRTPLREILGDSPFMRFTDCRVAERLEQAENEKCRGCAYWERCRGGCPLLGYGFSETKNWLAADPFACRFYRGGFAERKSES